MSIERFMGEGAIAPISAAFYKTHIPHFGKVASNKPNFTLTRSPQYNYLQLETSLNRRVFAIEICRES